MVNVRVQTVSGKLFHIQVDHGIPVADLRRRCSETTGMPLDSIKLVLKAKALADEDPPPALPDGFTLLVLTAPKVPPAHIAKLVDANKEEEEEGEDIKSFIASLTWRSWTLLIVWVTGLWASSYLGHAVPYLLLSAMMAMLCNLGKRKDGEASAYSIFNGFRELPGQLNAGHFEQAIRRGEMIGM